ncbi:MAG: isoaspartyl peptidase/L-asparaginase [Candidatus Competibacterales bacterium]
MKRLIIHGGIADFEGKHLKAADYQRDLDTIVREAWGVLLTQGAREAVLHAVRLLEDFEIFNAGTGSRIQADGEIRMSAALMDGARGVFSGVINIQYVRHPIDVAARLATEPHRVLAGPEATRFARQVGMDSHFPFTTHRLQEFRQGRDPAAQGTGTVGAVALDDNGVLVVGTSTGGVGNERPGRVSDSATVAGTYASPTAGVSCTGVGEQLVDQAVASRVVVRSEEMDLASAVTRTLAEGRRRGDLYGLIAIAADGTMVADQTEGQVLFASHDEEGPRVFGASPPSTPL